MTHKLSDLMTMSDLAQIIVDTIHSWKETEGNPFKLKQEVLKHLNEASEKIILESVGLEKKYGGGFEIKGDTVISKYIKATANDAVDKWVKDQAGNIPHLSEAEKADFRVVFKREYLIALKSGIKDAAVERAHKDAQELREIIGASISELSATAKSLLKATEEEIEKKPKIKFRVFSTRGTLAEVEFICPINIDGDKVSSVDIANPSMNDVWFLVKVKSSISDASGYIVTDCKEYLPCRVRLRPGEDGSVWVDESESRIIDKFDLSQKIFELMNEEDMSKIRKAVNTSV